LNVLSRHLSANPVATPSANLFPLSMSETKWQIGVPTGNHLATYRGIRIVVKLNSKGNPIEIGWFIGGRLQQSVPVNFGLESAKQIGVDLVDERIPIDERWAQAEKHDRESELWNTV
jgi:hypothetical protein